MSGAGRRPKAKHFKHRMIADGGAAGGGEAEADDEQQPPPPANDAAQAPNPANPSPAKKAGKVRGGSGGAKEQ